MSALTRITAWPNPALNWQPGVVALMDEHHLVASSGEPGRRASFVEALESFLLRFRDAEVLSIQGRLISDLVSFCRQLERLFPGETVECRIDGAHGVTATLRSHRTFDGRRLPRHRFYVWQDADVLLRADPELFGRLVDALAGVAAEAEYASDDRLLLHRVAFVGGPLLDSYARYERGQFRRWYDDGLGEPFWSVATGLARPPVRQCSIDSFVRLT